MTSVTPVMKADARNREKRRRSRLRRSWPAGRAGTARDQLPRRRRRQAAHAFSPLDRTGRETVDANAGRTPLGRQRTCQRVDAGLRGGRVALPTVPSSCNVALMFRTTPLRALQVRKGCARHVEGALQIDVDDRAEAVRR